MKMWNAYIVDVTQLTQFWCPAVKTLENNFLLEHSYHHVTCERTQNIVLCLNIVVTFSAVRMLSLLLCV
jgi:hypothetical protein